VSVSVLVTEFWTGAWIACEVLPPMVFPGDFEIALAWIEERTLHYSKDVSPF